MGWVLRSQDSEKSERAQHKIGLILSFVKDKALALA
jgi:hypothetical protein